MRIESVSAKSVTIAIFTVLGAIAVTLSIAASSYFKNSVLETQAQSLSRIIEVATQAVLEQAKEHAYDLGMKLGNSSKVIATAGKTPHGGRNEELVGLLNDPFINGFVGFSQVHLVKLRVFDLDGRPVAESSEGMAGLTPGFDPVIESLVSDRTGTERLKGVDAIWSHGGDPLMSIVVPLGGLRPLGYMEVIIDPAFNLPEIAEITRTPIRVSVASGKAVISPEEKSPDNYLPVEYLLHTTNGQPAFYIVGLEDVATLNRQMLRTQIIAITGFLTLSFMALLFALWIFNRFMLEPLHRIAGKMGAVLQGRMNALSDSRGLKEFDLLANAFNAMTEQVQMRTSDLERLLDLDESAILYFDTDGEILYFNRSATSLFGYDKEELAESEMADLFLDEAVAIITSRSARDMDADSDGSVLLECRRKDGEQFRCDAVINVLDVSGYQGIAVTLSRVEESVRGDTLKRDDRLDAVEKSLVGLLTVARDNPHLLSGLGNIQELTTTYSGDEKALLREQVVNIMNLSLLCWERELGKSKIEFAEESRIWQVYIDKSTPTTRTLDKYLNLESCPKNPRTRKVVESAEFVLRSIREVNEATCTELQDTLDAFRLILSGVQPGK